MKLYMFFWVNVWKCSCFREILVCFYMFSNIFCEFYMYAYIFHVYVFFLVEILEQMVYMHAHEMI